MTRMCDEIDSVFTYDVSKIIQLYCRTNDLGRGLRKHLRNCPLKVIDVDTSKKAGAVDQRIIADIGLHTTNLALNS